MFGCTRGVEAFLKKTAIAYGGDPSKNAKFWWYAIAVFFKNASTPRVQATAQEIRTRSKEEKAIMIFSLKKIVPSFPLSLISWKDITYSTTLLPYRQIVND